jgi:hypothetical protein
MKEELEKREKQAKQLKNEKQQQEQTFGPIIEPLLKEDPSQLKHLLQYLQTKVIDLSKDE